MVERKISSLTELTGEPKFSGSDQLVLSPVDIVLNKSYPPMFSCPFDAKYRVTPSDEINGASSS